MRVLMISANTEQLNMPTIPLGAGLVAAAARGAGHEVAFLDLMHREDPGGAVREAIRQTDPRVIGISIRNIDDQDIAAPSFLLEKTLPVVAACREASGAVIVLGGAGYSIFPEAVLAHLGADLGVVGDGEHTFVALLDRLERGMSPAALPGVVARGARGPATGPGLGAVLDPPPWPDRDLAASALAGADATWIPVQTRRGCPNRCSYCSTESIQGRAVRCMDPQRAVRDIERLAAAGHRRFYFVDNSFNIPESHALELCRSLAPLGVTWRCILYPGKVTARLVDEMAAAGCAEVALGFESGSPAVLRQLNKHYSPGEVLAAARLLHRRKIRTVGFLLLGGPGETRETVEQSLAFVQTLPLSALRITVGIRIYPNTPLAQRALAEGVIRPDDDLLRPRFYLAADLDPWLHQRVKPGFYPVWPPPGPLRPPP